MAGAFKRAAAIAINSIEKYLAASPIYFTKNLFPPETQHGRQKGYGFYGAYSLLIASQLGFAALVADSNLKELKCPAECGGYIFISEGRFHKTFANCGGIQIEIDSNADFNYDSTGLGRMHFANCPVELILSTPITATPGYLTTIPPSSENIAIGPSWDRLWLAGLNGDRLHATCKVLEETGNKVRLEMHYDYGSSNVSELYDISSEGVEIAVTQHQNQPLEFRIPLLKTNGKDTSEIKICDHGFGLSFQGFIYQVSCLTPDVKVAMESFEAPNQNGIYSIGRFSVTSNHMLIHFSASRKNHN